MLGGDPYFPAIEPRYVVFVRIDEPQGAFYGGAVAAPVFREAMESTVLTSTMSAAPSLMERVRSPDRVVWKVSETFSALPALAAAVPDTATEDPIGATSSPSPTSSSDADLARWTPLVASTPFDDVGTGPTWDPRTQVKVPDLSGLSLREAIRRAGDLGIEIAFSGVGAILEQEPEPGEVVPRGATVRVVNP